ncbi:thiol-disulfide oxidoreductase DCC family protein [Winogradskyella aquimaris]|uniref:DCC1-like thiol-disulfide oxidoreductase family protein n=1 Tax=Winogradskyella aquimaris TaxID=864074 RepID=A0ABU5ELC8_9FLAO|nr:DCC1-like thiol-disulfide oxidoreductase family protein [Winogradskyella aquimaris]MDY2586560.1 DCC1-like thiol-disulfide oxidoreductase family protein [Winogradskyella aquimaris]
MLNDIPKDKELILFDGVCNLCNSSVLFVIKRDKKNKFLFAPLQGDVGKTITEHFEIDTELVDSIILYSPTKEKIYYKSTAALEVAKQLNFPTKLMALFLIIPAFIRNWVYDYVAKNRYQWYGKKEACMIPTPELKAKFLM